MEEELFKKLIHANSLLASGLNFKTMVVLLVEVALEISGSDLGCVYLLDRPEAKWSGCKLYFKKGRYDVPDSWACDNDFLLFIRECKEAAIISEKKQDNLAGLLLDPDMQSGMVFPLATPSLMWGLLFLNAMDKNKYTKKLFLFLTYFSLLAGEKLYTARLIEKIEAELTVIEELNSFQEAIISALPQLLLILDPTGSVRYYNTAARDYWQLFVTDTGKPFYEVLKPYFDSEQIKQIQTALRKCPCTISLKENKNDCFMQCRSLAEPYSVMKLTILPFHKYDGQVDLPDYTPGTLLCFSN